MVVTPVLYYCFQILHSLGRLTKEDIEQEEPAVDYFPEPPVAEMAVEKYLPSIGQLLTAVIVGVAAVMLIVLRPQDVN